MGFRFESFLQKLSDSSVTTKRERVTGSSVFCDGFEFREVDVRRLPKPTSTTIFSTALAVEDNLRGRYVTLAEFRSTALKEVKALGLLFVESDVPRQHINASDLIWTFPLFIDPSTDNQPLVNVVEQVPYFAENPVLYLVAHEKDVFKDEEALDARLLD